MDDAVILLKERLIKLNLTLGFGDHYDTSEELMGIYRALLGTKHEGKHPLELTDEELATAVDNCIDGYYYSQEC